MRTPELAKIMGVTNQQIYMSLSKHGRYRGVKPMKDAETGRVDFDDAEVETLIRDEFNKMYRKWEGIINRLNEYQDKNK